MQLFFAALLISIFGAMALAAPRRKRYGRRTRAGHASIDGDEMTSSDAGWYGSHGDSGGGADGCSDAGGGSGGDSGGGCGGDGGGGGGD